MVFKLLEQYLDCKGRRQLSLLGIDERMMQHRMIMRAYG